MTATGSRCPIKHWTEALDWTPVLALILLARARSSVPLSFSNMNKDDWPREKHWKHVYTRSEKLHRARQLGFVYPRESESDMAERESLKILFVCTMNQWRSPTAERIYADKPLVVARSRGTSEKAAQTVKGTDIQWADIILVMEHKHRERLLSNFPGEMQFKEIHVLDIPDNYRFMDPELIAEIEASVDPILTGR